MTKKKFVKNRTTMSKDNIIEIPTYYIKDYDKNREEVFNYRKEMATKQAINEDYDLSTIISFDMSTIWNEVGGQDGMYDNFPITRVYRDNELIRVYALDGGGGVAIISNKKTRFPRFQVVTLGEDDGWHFLESRRIYEEYVGNKQGFIYLLSEALSLFNNVKL